MRRRFVLLLVVLGASVTAAPSGGATTKQFYYCTTTIGSGTAAYGVIFSGANRARLRAGCRIFVRGGGWRLHWRIYRPPGWVISAQYANLSVEMTASLIAPPSMSDVIYRLTKRPIFTSHGWIFLRRGGG